VCGWLTGGVDPGRGYCLLPQAQGSVPEGQGDGIGAPQQGTVDAVQALTHAAQQRVQPQTLLVQAEGEGCMEVGLQGRIWYVQDSSRTLTSINPFAFYA